MNRTILILLASATLLLSCTKEAPDSSVGPTGTGTGSGPVLIPGGGNPGTSTPDSKTILIDASKDGGGWWFPQGPQSGYNPNDPHQGKALADYLKSLGYKVHELGRGVIITNEMLQKYKYVIRSSAFFNYSSAELDAYTNFLGRSSALLLINDHLQNTVNDRLSQQLGLNFEGSYWGPITSFVPHAVTNNISSVPFIAGSVIKTWDNSRVTVLGSINGYGAMGLVNHQYSKIFFLGDLNGIEQLPQPFTSNLIKWLFQ